MARNSTIAGHLAEHAELTDPEFPEIGITDIKAASVVVVPEHSHGVGPIEVEEEVDPWAAPQCECVVVAGEVCRCRGVKKGSND